MNLGDFSELAQFYSSRPGYSMQIIKAITGYIESYGSKVDNIVEVGAGTGKLTEVLLKNGYNVKAVEPNDNMRAEGKEALSSYQGVEWIAGTGEETNVGSGIADWAVMASSFHWTDPNVSLPELARVLKPHGFFTAIWNPRNIEKSEFHQMVESKIYEICPSIKRVSSGAKKHAKDWSEILVSTGDFESVIFMEVDDIICMTPERYKNVWRSVNDIRAQAGDALWEKILNMIDHEADQMNEIVTPYKNRAWTVRKTK